MSRELKVGLGVIALLGVVLAVVVAKRWRPPVRIVPTVETSPDLARSPTAQPRERAAVDQPLVLRAQPQPRGTLEQTVALEEPRKSEPEPSGSYLPRPTKLASPEPLDIPPATSPDSPSGEPAELTATTPQLQQRSATEPEDGVPPIAVLGDPAPPRAASTGVPHGAAPAARTSPHGAPAGPVEIPARGPIPALAPALPGSIRSATPGALSAADPPHELQFASREPPREFPAPDLGPGLGTGGPAAAVGQDPPSPAQHNPSVFYRPPAASLTQTRLPVSPPVTSPLTTGTYTVAAGDSLYRLAARAYGDARWFLALAAHNRQRLPNPHRLQVGDQIDLVSPEELRRLYPGLCPRDRGAAGATVGLAAAATPVPAGGRIYLVEEGDSLYEIARYELGDSQRWVEIYELNRSRIGNDEHFLVPGLTLTLPGPAKIQTGAQRVTQGGDALRR